MSAREKWEQRNELVQKLLRADQQLRADAAKPESDKTRRSAAAWNRALSKRNYLANELRQLGGEPWTFEQSEEVDVSIPFRSEKI
jgi:hypothetical protein